MSKFLDITFNMNQAAAYMHEHAAEKHHIKGINYHSLPYLFTYEPNLRTATVRCKQCYSMAICECTTQTDTNYSLDYFIDKYDAEAEIRCSRVDREEQD